jgi:hypothetical protein
MKLRMAHIKILIKCQAKANSNPDMHKNQADRTRMVKCCGDLLRVCEVILRKYEVSKRHDDGRSGRKCMILDSHMCFDDITCYVQKFT